MWWSGRRDVLKSAVATGPVTDYKLYGGLPTYGLQSRYIWLDHMPTIYLVLLRVVGSVDAVVAFGQTFITFSSWSVIRGQQTTASGLVIGGGAYWSLVDSRPSSFCAHWSSIVACPTTFLPPDLFFFSFTLNWFVQLRTHFETMT